MKKEEINIRDPFVLLYNDKYYMYGTRSETCWGKAEGFDCYVSEDLEDWQGPIEIFKRPEGFWADEKYWAPECVFDDGWFYLITTLASETKAPAVYSLRSKNPTGPFEIWSKEELTPKGHPCIDGTIFIDKKGIKWLFYSYDFPNTAEGSLCAIRLKDDYSESYGDQVWIADSKDAAWSHVIPFGKKEFGKDNLYFSDGPSLFYDNDGVLHSLLSSWGKNGYAIGLVKSLDGEVEGKWEHVKEPIYGENGGHGMIFETKDGKRKLALHFPNDKGKERPIFIDYKG